MVERRVSEDGKQTTWSVPGWFIKVCVTISLLWVVWISGGVTMSLSELSKGERNTLADGVGRDLLIEANRKAIESLEIPPPRFEAVVIANGKAIKENKELINSNHAMITELLIQLKVFQRNIDKE